MAFQLGGIQASQVVDTFRDIPTGPVDAQPRICCGRGLDNAVLCLTWGQS